MLLRFLTVVFNPHAGFRRNSRDEEPNRITRTEDEAHRTLELITAVQD
jgi:hypothetical protein